MGRGGVQVPSACLTGRAVPKPEAADMEDSSDRPGLGSLRLTESTAAGCCDRSNRSTWTPCSPSPTRSAAN